LEKRFPEMSAKHLKLAPVGRWIAVLGCCVLIGGFHAPRVMLAAALLVIGLPFLSIALVRCAGVIAILSRGDQRSPPDNRPAGPIAPPSPKPLPRYAVLVPLYKEAEVAGQLVKSLEALDYPKKCLQISFIVEHDDEETRSAIAACMLPDHMRVVVVPDGTPRTKPRALNYALADAIGEYVVVFDAEDLPDPDQLRRALEVLQSNPGRIGCVQARLEIYNPGKSFFTRQFTIEYSALFCAILPALERLGIPVPLGGTSNHFPREVVEHAGGWDAFNVTEDADLGIRLARLGYEVRVLNATTREEAPQTFTIWFRQRTRWLKGWMQTYLVHMREPGRLLRDLGPYRFAGFRCSWGA
jgi:cellulose synthase/poly-beta-1,6-N-acetylglucosamine synthase-like glycosyltransferase